MELEFKRVGSRWVAEFEATGKFNLHIERKKRGSLALFQKSVADGEYASESVWSDSAEAVVDKDFSAEIYPKYFKVTSGSEVVNGVVTMEGEGNSGGVTISPLTINDVSIKIYNGDMGEERDVLSLDNISLSGLEELRIYTDAPLYAGPNQNVLLTYNKDNRRHEFMNDSYGAFTATLDLYIQV